MNVLIVDDEAPARARMRRLLVALQNNLIIEDVDTIREARERLSEAQIDVIFLDIQMPPENGFDLLPSVSSETSVVFVTAFDSYAIRAFDANAVDYLLKPVSPSRLQETLYRLKDRENTLPPKQGDQTPGPLIFRDGRSWHRLETESIRLIRADGTYSVIVTKKQEEHMVLRSLNEWMSLLPSTSFTRLSRSLIINFEFIERFDVLGRDEGKLWLEGLDEPLTLRRIAIRNLRQCLS